MKILFLTHRLPCPPDRGCKVRSAALLQGLTQRHDVWCAGFLDQAKDKTLQAETHASITSLRHACRGFLGVPFSTGLAGYRALGGLLTGSTATESYFRSRPLRKGVLRWSREIGFDAVFAFSSGIAPLALQVAAARRVLCMDDLDSRKWAELARHGRLPSRLIYGTESRRLAAREREWIAAFDATLMVSEREAEAVADPGLRSRVHVVPPILPGVDGFENACPPVASTGLVVGFLGVMDYEPNVDAACWMAGEIWPRIRQECPGARLLIVGRSPTSAVRGLAQDPSIVVTGTVPKIDSYLAAMRVHVAPLRVSRGVQIKVLTAMAAGRPCVVTSAVAEGLGARAGRDLLVADSPAGFAAAVIDMLEHPDNAEQIGRAGQRFVNRFKPEQVIRQVESLLGRPEEVFKEACLQPARESTVGSTRPSEAVALLS